MTVAGLAFIAGGLATLISFRAVLFGGRARRRDRDGSSARRRRTPAPRPAPVSPAKAAASVKAPLKAPVKAPMKAPAKAPVKAEVKRQVEIKRPAGRAVVKPVPTGLADIGLADDEDEDAHRRLGLDDQDPGEEESPEPRPEREEERTGWEDGYLEDELWPPRRRRRDPEPGGRAWAARDAESPRGYAGRYPDRPIPDWDWPRYSDVDERLPTGDYWTPVPDDLYTSSAMDPLPPVPDYEPATGFDLPPIPATGPMPEWPPRKRRIHLPRSWAGRDDADRPYISRHSIEGH
ncbi:hypothetical protein GCM10009828_010950 [Actinoplanes couchii]|uniref:Secreted protein n=2 Tax=Actinoplanes couchii TaxID=403638 RepID=A0ABQ3X6J7_9ACTN|nr:hypothetical protein Aco03nite_025400 [Actinoplanes couchii]